MQKLFNIVTLSVMLLISVGCKGKEPEKSDFEKYNNPNFKLSDHPKIQGVYIIAKSEKLLEYFGILKGNESLYTDECTEFDSQKSLLKIRPIMKKKDVEIKIINLIDDNLYLSVGEKVVRAKLFYKDENLAHYVVYPIDKRTDLKDPETLKELQWGGANIRNYLAWGQGGIAPEGYYEECIKRREEMYESSEVEAKQTKGMGPM
ncbi:hypothetical protein DLM76_18245 [Leptospira yasudae]|uniref:hypothetical protein n=1 Tax=Leptospira yasudae TaxID=2202201 RepID=UPI000E59A1F7|nr:hypothetical protein [Leptospira yasudae]RHX91109.1 hypothetical protein DLM76_18245 [Leptospira yasudae]